MLWCKNEKMDGKMGNIHGFQNILITPEGVA
jgi:hypothetical protein